MAVITGTVNLGDGDTGTAGQLQTIELNGHRDTNIATDDAALTERAGAFVVDGIEVQGAGRLVGRDVTIAGRGFTVDRAFPVTSVAYDMDGSTWVYTNETTHGGTAQTQYDLRGRIQLTDHKVIMTVPAGNLYFFGTSENAQNYVPVYNNLELINNGPGTIVLHTGSMDHTATDIRLDGINAVDGVTAQLKGFGAVFGFSLGVGTSTQNIDAAYATDWSYNTRIVHQGSLDTGGGNVSNTGAEVDLPAGNYTRWTNWDCSDSAGATAADGSSGVILQLNRNTATWLVNPDFGTATSDQHIGFHSANPPGRADDANRGSELRVLFAHRPQFRDAATLEALPNTLPTKVHYNTFTLAHNDFDSTTIPTRVNVRDEIELGTGGFANNGEAQVMVRDQYFRWTNTRVLNIRTEGTTSTNVAANLPREEGGRDPSLPQNTIFNTNDRHIDFQVRNYYYDFTLENELTTNTSPATSDADYTIANYDGTDLRQFLNGRAHDDDITGSSLVDDWYAKIRQEWYATDYNVIPEFPMEAQGTTLTFNANAELSDTAATNIAEATGRMIINSPAQPTLDATPLFTTFAFGTNTMAWDGYVWPDNVTIDRGIHTGFGNLNAVTWTATSNPSIQVADAAGTYDFADVFGTVTGNFTPSSVNAITVEVTPAQRVQVGNPALGTPVGNITFVVAPTTRTYVAPQQAGHFVIRNITAGTTTTETLTTASTLAARTFNLRNTDTNEYHIYWKRNSSSTADEGYSITHIGPVTGTDVTANETVNIIDTEIPAVLYEFNTGGASVVVANITGGKDDGTGTFNPAVQVSITGAETQIDGAQTLATLLQAANQLAYIEMVAANELTGTDLNPIDIAGISSAEIDTRYITLNTGNTSQQLVQGIFFTGGLPTSTTVAAGGINFDTVSSIPNPDGISIGEVRNAIDTSELAITASEAANGVGYLVSDGSDTNPVASGRIRGVVQPRRADYDADTDYTEVL